MKREAGWKRQIILLYKTFSGIYIVNTAPVIGAGPKAALIGTSTLGSHHEK